MSRDRLSYWRSVEERELETKGKERGESSVPKMRRRDFLTLMGASMALAGLSSGCIRKPVEKILPYSSRPEDLIPGNPLYFATVFNVGRVVQGILVESQEGRPTKVEGNPDHPMSLGKTDFYAQSSVLDLYDPDRSQKPKKKSKGGGYESASWKEFFVQVKEKLSGLSDKRGEGFALLVEDFPSPTFEDLLNKLKKKYPKLSIYRFDPAYPVSEERAYDLLGVKEGRFFYDFFKADRFLILDGDPLGLEGNTVIQTKGFASKRDISRWEKEGKYGDAKLNRLYAIEGILSLTGANADNRLPVKSSEVGRFLAGWIGYLLSEKGLKAPSIGNFGGLSAVTIEFYRGLSEPEKRRWQKWFEALAEDFLAHSGSSIIWVGQRQPSEVYALGLFANYLLKNVGDGRPVRLVKYPRYSYLGLDDLRDDIKKGNVRVLGILGSNPVYSSGNSRELKSYLEKVEFSFHLSSYFDETSECVKWHLPRSHYLECWGDLRSLDGTVSIRQPLIAPLYSTLSELELLAFLAGEKELNGHKLVQNYWKSQIKVTNFGKEWRRWLHRGYIVKGESLNSNVSPDWSKLAERLKSSLIGVKGFEINFIFDYSAFDGRFSNNPWLQEWPDPITKLTWDNAALISPYLSKKLGVKTGDWLELEVGGKSLKLPVFIVPGQAKEVIALPFGYGRKKGGKVAAKAGFDVYQLFDGRYFAEAKVKKYLNTPYLLATTQDHGRIEQAFSGYGKLKEPAILGKEGTERNSILREASLAEYVKDKELFKKLDPIEEKELKSLWKRPNESGGQQWGMVIDLSRCTGCSACVLACQAENNISIVGKDRVAVGREMHWVRIDRYFKGEEEDPSVAFQPVACAQCENAPCESVCPVAATAHSPDGLNDMAYNRCIGTRYCANNCPYKVRHFNFFNFSKENTEEFPLLKMQRNPDVTVRFRGVMEKCTYCVQRINAARIEAKRSGDGIIPDGAVVPACAQACPADAITFGDINDPKSKVSQLRELKERNYAMLMELNILPRTTYLARLNNPNPRLK